MQSATFAVGMMSGLLIAAFVMLTALMRYVDHDLDGFRRWLDNAGSPA